MKFSLSLLAGGLLVALASSNANAHITLTFPTPRTVKDSGQKGAPPCGTLGPKNPQKFRPGETIVVKFNETVSHEGHFRIAFDDDGMDFPTPMARKETNTTLPIFLDGLFEKTKAGPKGPHEQSITFPNKPCANCMLQVIQIMAVDPPYKVAAGQDIYYQCADIVLEGEPMGGADAGPGPSADAGAGGASGSGGASGGSTGTGGSTGSGGGTATGGSYGSGGSTASGGSTGTGGSTTGTGGSSSSGGKTGSGNATGGSSAPAAEESSAPSCSIGSSGNSPSAAFALLALGLVLVSRRRRR